MSARTKCFLEMLQRSSVRMYLVEMAIRYHLIITLPRRQRKQSTSMTRTVIARMIMLRPPTAARVPCPFSVIAVLRLSPSLRLRSTNPRVVRRSSDLVRAGLLIARLAQTLRKPVGRLHAAGATSQAAGL
jgi:hypothetical protein